MAAGDIYQVTDVQVCNNEPLANVFYYEVVDDSGAADKYLAVSNAHKLQIIPGIQLFQSSDLLHDCNLVRKVYPKTEPARVFTTSLSGLRTAQVFSANVGVKVKISSGIGSRNLRGRWFFGGLDETDTAYGRWEESDRTRFDTFLAAVITDVVDTGNTYRMQIYSRKLGQWNPIEQADVDPRLTKVRNRTPGICLIS